MANSVITATVIAKESIMWLENAFVMAKMVNREFEEEFGKSPNGYKIGQTVNFRRPNQFNVRTGATASIQDVTEGTVAVTVDKQKGVDFAFTSADLTLKIGEIGERILQPAMSRLANEIDMDLMNLYRDIPSWVGTPGQTIDSFPDYMKGAERLNEFSVPQDGRSTVLAPSDHAGLVSNFTGLYVGGVNSDALRNADLPQIAGSKVAMSQNVPTHIVGAYGGTPLINGANQGVTYLSVKDTFNQTLITDGWSTSVTNVLRAGDVFTIAGVYAVNNITKATLPFPRQFVVQAAANSDGSGNATLTISPPIVTSGAFQTVSAAPADNAAITVMGTANTGYRQNMQFMKDAFALVMVPMVKPPGAVDVGRETYKGLTVRVIPYYDGTNDISNWRLDVLYGVKTLDNRLATRQSGTP